MLLICIFLGFLYRIVFPKTLHQTVSWQPASVTALEITPGSFPLPEGGVFLSSRTWVGYLTREGVLAHGEAYSARLSGDEKELLILDPSSKRLVWLSPRARVSMETREEPFLWKGYWLLVSSDRLTFSRLETDLTPSWSRVLPAPMTTLDASNKLLAVGDVSGNVFLLSPEGKEEGHFRPGGSRFEVIYQLAVHPESERILILAGLEPKRLIVLEKGNDGYFPLQHERVEDNRRFSTPLHWIDADRFLFTDKEGERLQIRRVRSDWRLLVDIRGEPVFVDWVEGEDTCHVASLFQEELTWLWLDRDGKVLTKLTMRADQPWAHRFGKDFYFLRDEKLVRFSRGTL